jgi:hypothetical protein
VHVHVAVDADGLAGHEIAVIGGQENDRADQVRRVLIALEGAVLAGSDEEIQPLRGFDSGFSV